MLKLINKEEGKDYAQWLKHDKLLVDVKKYMLGATKYAISKRKMEKADKEQLKANLPLIEAASTSGALLEICEEGIELLLKYKLS